MKKIFLILIAVLMSLESIAPVFAGNDTLIIYVSPYGSDSADGSWKRPYRTLQKAVTESRNHTGEKHIRMRGGRYKAAATVSLNSKDSGLVIENVYGEKPEITGGDYIPYSAFRRCTDPVVMERLIEESAKRNLVEVYLPDVGITEFGTMKKAGFGISTSYSPTLTLDDRYLTYGEYPNGG